MILADKYNVKPLIALLNQCMKIKCSTPNIKDAIEFYPISFEFNLNEVREECWNTIKYNIEILIYLDDWFRYDVKFIKTLLEDSDLIITDELV